jgi:hypothetical protein
VPNNKWKNIMTRVVDANLTFTGSEPKFTQQLTKSELIKTLNWYAQNKEVKDAEKYASEYFKKHLKLEASQYIKEESTTFGFACRIMSNGGILPTENLSWFESKIESIKSKISNKKVQKKKEQDVDEVKTVNIQERIAEKTSEIIGELEGAFDELILTDFKLAQSPKAVMDEKTKSVHANKIIEFFKKRRAELDEATTTKDEQMIEAYSCYNKTQLKKLIQYCDQIITDAMAIIGKAAVSRKPRKRKAKSPEQLVSKLKYLQTYTEHNISSVNPKDIIGASQLWVYNTKYRKLGCYHASDSSGLSVKGTTIIGFSEMKSIQKTLRKPDEILTKVINGGKVYLRNALEEIRAVDSKLNGRINEDTILLRIIK